MILLILTMIKWVKDLSFKTKIIETFKLILYKLDFCCFTQILYKNCDIK